MPKQFPFVTRRRAALAMLAFAALAPAIGSAGATGSGANVEISNFTFNPAEITVHAGATVTFRNSDDIPHLVVASDGSFRSKALDTGDSAAIVFAKAGNYGYFCGLHPHMQGKVIVIP